MTHEEAMALLVRAGAEYVYEDTRKAIAAEIIAAVEQQRQKDAEIARQVTVSANWHGPIRPTGEAKVVANAIADAIEAQ